MENDMANDVETRCMVLSTYVKGCGRFPNYTDPNIDAPQNTIILVTGPPESYPSFSETLNLRHP